MTILDILMEFLEWMHQHEQQAAPSKSRRRSRRPNNSIDPFLREIELLKKELETAAKRKKELSNPTKPQETPEDQLEGIAKVVLSHLKISPRYYSSRIDDFNDKPSPRMKVRRDEASKIARKLGIDFSKVDYTPEAFRRALEIEGGRSNGPTMISRLKPTKGNNSNGENPAEISGTEG